jgi:YcaO-like protein with predicted kinase domain
MSDDGLNARHSGVPPIVIRDEPFRAAKCFVAGTHRCVAPEETWDRLRPHLRRAGITRIADVSGLDRVGITTAVAVRPNARTLATSAGKGFSRIAAVVSAAMEGFELHHAEHPQVPAVVATYHELAGSASVVEETRMPLSRFSLFRPDRPESWVRGWDLLQHRETYLPFVSVAMIPPPTHRPRIELSMYMTSNGLAGGNHLLEAACAALYEVIERDAVTCHRHAELMAGYRAPLVALESLPYPLVLDLQARFRAAGLRALVRDCTKDTGVPVFVAQLSDDHAQGFGVFGGWGAHLDPEIALVRALTEAAQSRVIYISGSRDDIFRLDERQARYDDNPATVAWHSAPGLAAAPMHIDESGASFEEDLATLLGKVRNVGIRQVVLTDLTRSDFGIPVVRIVAPGLEGCIGPDYVHGARAVTFLAAARELMRGATRELPRSRTPQRAGMTS